MPSPSDNKPAQQPAATPRAATLGSPRPADTQPPAIPAPAEQPAAARLGKITAVLPETAEAKPGEAKGAVLPPRAAVSAATFESTRTAAEKILIPAGSPFKVDFESEKFGLPKGGKVTGAYDPFAKSGVLLASYQGEIKGPTLTVGSEVFAFNKFDGKGTKAFGSVQVSGDGPLNLKAGLLFDIGKSNNVAATATIADLITITATPRKINTSVVGTSEFPLSSRKNGPVMSLGANFGFNGLLKQVEGGVKAEIKR